MDATAITPSLLRSWPLPMPAPDGDKEVRGHLLIVAGSAEMPGAIVLAATAAMRAGAGKLTLATGASVAAQVAIAMPEARVIGLDETAQGGFRHEARHQLAPLAGKVDAVLVGPGMCDTTACCELMRHLLPLFADSRLILDARAMQVVRQPAQQGSQFNFKQPVLLTPHAGELAQLMGLNKDAVLADPHGCAVEAARRWHAIVALKGALTVIAMPDGTSWTHGAHAGGNIGLAISGSGDTLAGIITGLAARGAPLEQACAWGIALHALAGEQLALRFGILGYLAREIPAEIPALLRNLAP
ncbi:NAD(P)H-hydrate dehydratase [Janthinobacterium sp. GW458P]|uniref:NAD(P)H-hydrate dehydratase n=1 Tax=Janthinobacterium sp. GW458P TaxID=1981504 RepID=UPI001D035B06|nr:NAD(P)H-hydrate dehydratase [Janthinobacterium sp. GW458P]